MSGTWDFKCPECGNDTLEIELYLRTGPTVVAVNIDRPGRGYVTVDESNMDFEVEDIRCAMESCTLFHGVEDVSSYDVEVA